MSVSQKVNVNASSSTWNFVEGVQYNTTINISSSNPSTLSPASCHILLSDNCCSVEESIQNAQISTKLKLPPRLSSIFTGRTDILHRLDDFLVPSETSVGLGKQRVFVLYGLGGVGKSQIGLKFVEEHSDR
jgi:hypothetical protein